MRKLYLFILIIISAPGLCNKANAAEPFHIELYGDSQQTGGARFQCPVTELRFSARNDRTNFGILFTTENLYKKVPVEIKYGNLSVAGTLSKLNSPELSNGTSPFSSSILSTGCLSASLPGYSSFSKEESTFIQFKLNRITKSQFTCILNMAFLPENSMPVFSSLISNKFFSNQLIISASCTAGKFSYEDNNSSSWFLSSPYFAADERFCSLFQLSAGYKKKETGSGIQSAFMAAVYESPFGPYTATYRADVKLSVKKSEFYTSAFLNSYEDLLTSSEKTLLPELQLKTGFNTKKPFLTGRQKLYFVKFGTNAYTKINLTGNEHPLRVNTGLQFSSDLISLAFSVSADAKLISTTPEELPQTLEKDNISFQIKNSWYFKWFTPAITLGIEPGHYKLVFNLANNTTRTRHKISSSCTLNLYTENGVITDKKISASLNCRLNFKLLTITGKLSATLE